MFQTTASDSTATATPMAKKWYQSATIKGALVAGASALLSPSVLALIPARYAWAGVIIGAVASQIGLRRALP